MIREIVPTHRRAENLAQQIAEVVGGLPSETVLELVDQILLDFRAANVTQAAIAKADAYAEGTDSSSAWHI